MDDQILRKELLKLLSGEGAHDNFKNAVHDIPKKYYGAEVPESPYTLWRIIQHMRISQWDILDYIINPNYQEKSWPEDYWPKQKVPPSQTAWNKCIQDIKRDLKELENIVKDRKSDLLKPIPYVKNGPTLLCEILLVADHNSYHIGQIIFLRGILGIWQD